jgi:hypothetical protein
MATIPTQSLTEPFHPYPDSADNTAPGATADAGEFFSTLLDIINPLQHIPLVSKLYREWTGDEINSPARMVGGGGGFWRSYRFRGRDSQCPTGTGARG